MMPRKREAEARGRELLERQRREENLASYSVGDFVLSYSAQGNGNLQIAVIVDARPVVRTSAGREWTWWRCKVRWAQGWSLHALERRVQRALEPAEITHYRKLGMLPLKGMPEDFS